MPLTVLLKYGRPVAKCDPWIHQATQGPTIDGPFGDQWNLGFAENHVSICTCA